MTLSTPPNSDGVLTSCQVEPAASTVTNDRRITSESSSSKSNKINLTAKSPCVALKRLTDKELKNHGFFLCSCSTPSSNEQPQKKKPRLDSVTDFDKKTSKIADSRTRTDGNRKVADLFGDDSDNEAVPSKTGIEIQKTPPLNLDALDYDYVPEKEDEEAGSSRPTETDREKSTKTGKKDPGKDKRKEKRKKEDEKARNGDRKSKPTKSSREKGDKGPDKSPKEKEKEKVVLRNPLNWKIPKRPNVKTTSSSTTVGLPPLLQENLDQVMKGNASIPVKENLPTLNRESETANEKSLANGDAANNISSKDLDVAEPIASPNSSQMCNNDGRSILRITYDSSKVGGAKSVNFAENLTSVRSISPPISGTYIQTTVVNELGYEPKSSPRSPVAGIRPL